MVIESCKVRVPAKDFSLSMRFYAALGFAQTPGWGGTVDCEFGAMKFRLQDYFVRDWAENLMFVLDVDDANAWYERARLVLADGTFPQARVKPPEAIDDALVTHLWDPSGVLLVIVAPRTRA